MHPLRLLLVFRRTTGRATPLLPRGEDLNQLVQTLDLKLERVDARLLELIKLEHEIRE